MNVTGGLGLECSLKASVSANGMAGPIPVTAGIEGELTAFAGVGAKLSSGGSVRVDAGATTIGLPPVLVWLPQVSFSNPKFTLDAETFAEARASIGAGVKLGIGNDNVASATVKVGTSMNLTAQPGSCSWDARFGEFSGAGKVLKWDIETPKTPALFTTNLWRGCQSTGGGTGTGSGTDGDGSGGRSPPPPPPPPPGDLTPSRGGSPSAFAYAPGADAGLAGTWPASDGWWLSGEGSNNDWRYRWLSPSGARGPQWSSSDNLISVARGRGSAMFMSGLAPSGDVRIIGVGPDGPRVERSESPNAYGPCIQELVGGQDGKLYWYAALKSGWQLLQLDPNTLQTVHARPFSADNAGISATPTGLVVIRYDGTVWRIPYSEFRSGTDGHPFSIPGVPLTHRPPGGYSQFSLGEGGTAADVDNQSASCSALITSARHPDGTSWERTVGSLTADDVPGCEVSDLDALSDGRIVYTLRGQDATYLMWVTVRGERQRLEAIGPTGTNITSTVDPSGLVATVGTELLPCPPGTQPEPPPGSFCSKVRVTGYRNGELITAERLVSPRWTMTPFIGFGGRPHVAISNGQILVEALDVDPHTCGSDNCTPYGASFNFRTVLAPAILGLRPAFVWW